MVLELKLRKVGNSLGVVLPKEALARLNVHEGDTDSAYSEPGFSFPGSASTRRLRKSKALPSASIPM